MRGRALLLAVLCVAGGSLALGCASNECSGNSVCGDGNGVAFSASPSRDPGGPPLTFDVRQTDPWDACEGGTGRVYPTAPSMDEIAAHVDSHDVRTTAEYAAHRKRLAAFDRRFHAVTADLTTIELTLQGKSDHAVTVQDVTVDVLDVRPTPRTGLAVQRIGACGDSNVTSFLANLDRKVPELTFHEGRNSEGKMRVRGFPVQVSGSDPEVLTITAFTTADIHTFGLDVRWTSDGRSGTTKVREADGSPFSVAAAGSAPQYLYEQQSGTFSPKTFTIDPDDPLGDPVPLKAP